MANQLKRKRRIASVADALIFKSREAALAAVQIFNNPQITFKSEIFIVIMCIAWTYLLHAYYRKKKIKYIYFNQSIKAIGYEVKPMIKRLKSSNSSDNN